MSLECWSLIFAQCNHFTQPTLYWFNLVLLFSYWKYNLNNLLRMWSYHISQPTGLHPRFRARILARHWDSIAAGMCFKKCQPFCQGYGKMVCVSTVWEAVGDPVNIEHGCHHGLNSWPRPVRNGIRTRLLLYHFDIGHWINCGLFSAKIPQMIRIYGSMFQNIGLFQNIGRYY